MIITVVLLGHTSNPPFVMEKAEILGLDRACPLESRRKTEAVQAAQDTGKFFEVTDQLHTENPRCSLVILITIGSDQSR
jgi:hypothetical protein